MVPALIAAIPAITQLVTGIAQKAKANKLEKGNHRSTLDVPGYEIPPEVQQYINGLIGQSLSTRLPGQSAIEDQITGGTEKQIQSMIDTGAPLSDILNVAASLQGSESNTMLNLGVNAANDYRQRQIDATKGLLVGADAKNKKYDLDKEEYLKEFAYNKDEPYKETAAAVSALRYGAGQNTYGGAKDLSSIGVLASMNPGMFGGTNTGATGNSGGSWYDAFEKKWKT